MNGAAEFIAEYLKISIDDALKVQTILATEGFRLGFCPLVACSQTYKNGDQETRSFLLCQS